MLFHCCSFSIAANGKGIAEGGEIEAQNLN